MKRMNLYLGDRYNRLEIYFFISYFLFFNVITGLEYFFYESHSKTLFFKGIPSQVVYGLFDILSSLIFYKILIQRCLIKKKYLVFLIGLIAFLIGLNFYKTGVEWAISKFSFLPESVSSTAKKRYEKMLVLSPHFSIIYMFREFLVLFALAYFIHSARLDKQMNYLKQQQLQAELKYLKVQLQPHFFFNTLNNIYSLTIEQSPKAAQLVARHSQMMRYILYDSSSHVVDLQKEIDFLLNYCKVESIRYNENIKIVFETQGINNKMMIEPLLLLPFIENTFKHGISEEINIGYVNILVCLNENELILETKNSKASGAIKNIGKGIGLTNAENRLKILYPDKYQIEVFEDDRNYFLYLTIKLRLNG